MHHFDGQVPNVAEHAQHVLQDVSPFDRHPLPSLLPLPLSVSPRSKRTSSHTLTSVHLGRQPHSPPDAKLNALDDAEALPHGGYLRGDL